MYTKDGQRIEEYIPYDLVAEHEMQCYANHGQSAHRLAERGGLYYPEAFFIIHDSRYDINMLGKTEEEKQKIIDNARRVVLAKCYEWIMEKGLLKLDDFK